MHIARSRSLIEGPVASRLILFSLPMIAGNMLQQVYSLVDTFIVGKYLGAGALAAVGSSYTLMVFITSIIIGLCMGSGAFMSADFGAGDRRRLEEDMYISFVFILGVTLVLYVLIYPGMDGILRLLKTPEEIFAITGEYTRITAGGLVFVFVYNYAAFALRAVGDSVTPLVTLAASSALNIALDLYFIIELGLGVRGAALATVISQGFAGAGIMLWALVKLPELKSAFRERRVSRTRIRKIIAGDLATGVQQSVMNFGILMIQGLVNSFGTVIMAAFAAAVKIDTLAYMPTQEFGNAYSLFISQNEGAGKGDRVKAGTRSAAAIAAVFSLAVSAFVFVLDAPLMRIFVEAGELEIIAEGVRYLRIEGAAYIGIGILFLWYGYFRGIGRPRVSVLLTVISLGTRVALAYALAPNTALGVTAIWLAIPIGWMLADMTGLYLYRRTESTWNGMAEGSREQKNNTGAEGVS